MYTEITIFPEAESPLAMLKGITAVKGKCVLKFQFNRKKTIEKNLLEVLEQYIDLIMAIPDWKEKIERIQASFAYLCNMEKVANDYISHRIAVGVAKPEQTPRGDVDQLEQKLMAAPFFVQSTEQTQLRLAHSEPGRYFVQQLESGEYSLSFGQLNTHIGLFAAGMTVSHATFQITKDNQIVYHGPLNYKKSFKNWGDFIQYMATIHRSTQLKPGTNYQTAEETLSQLHKEYFKVDNAFDRKNRMGHQIEFAAKHHTPSDMFAALPDNQILVVPSTTQPCAVSVHAKSKENKYQCRFIALPSGQFAMVNDLKYMKNGALDFSNYPLKDLPTIPDTVDPKAYENLLCGRESKTVNFKCPESRQYMKKPLILDCCGQRIDEESVRKLTGFPFTPTKMECPCCKKETQLPTRVDRDLQGITAAWLLDKINEAGFPKNLIFKPNELLPHVSKALKNVPVVDESSSNDFMPMEP